MANDFQPSDGLELDTDSDGTGLLTLTMQPDKKLLHALRIRLGDLLYRHMRVEDAALSDRGLVLAVMQRYQRYLEEAIIDVNE